MDALGCGEKCFRKSGLSGFVCYCDTRLKRGGKHMYSQLTFVLWNNDEAST